jgi:succinyl-CoA synthetase beta subunit
MIEALRLLNNEPDVKSILVNIFGGILRCDLLVSAIIKATEKYNLKKQIVLRLKGTNADLVYLHNIGSRDYQKLKC